MAAQLSNSLTDLSDRIAAVHAEFVVANRTAADKALAAGSLLDEAKEACRHGEWLPFLARAGVAERQAQRLMALARSGLKPDMVTDLGGIGATLRFISERRLPSPGQALYVSLAGFDPKAIDLDIVGVVWSAEEDGGPAQFYHVGAVDFGDPSSGSITERPISGRAFRRPDGTFFNGVWETLNQLLKHRLSQMTFHLWEGPDYLDLAFWQEVRKAGYA